MTIQISFKRINKVFDTGPYAQFGIFEQWWCIFHLDLCVSRYCVKCLSCTSGKSLYHVLYFCRRHLCGPCFSDHLILCSPTAQQEHSSLCAWIPPRQDQWSKYHANFWHCRALVFRSPTFDYLCVSLQQTFVSTSLAIICQAWRSFVISPVYPQTTHIHLRLIQWILRNLSMHLTILNLHHRSNYLQYFSPTKHPRMCLSSW